MRITGIYKITSPTGRVYIGQSTNMKLRFEHYRRLYKIKGQQRIYNSLIKHGIENHKFEIVHELPNDVSDEVLSTYEQLYMDQYRGCGVEIMNLKEAGKHGKYSEESRKKMSESQKGKKLSPETIAKRVASYRIKLEKDGHGSIGRKLTDEHILKIYYSRNGYKHTEETKRKIGEANKKHIGRKLSEAHKASMSRANLGKKLSEDHKKKIGESNKKVPRNSASEETKQKMSLSHKGKKMKIESIRKSSEKRIGQKRSIESKQKMREAQLRYRQNLKNAI